jgi:hypothetical protein
VSAGLPGVGLAGLFMILTALLMPVVEVGRALLGRGKRSRWRSIGRQWFLAAGMVGAYVGLGAAAQAVVGSGSHGSLSRVNRPATEVAKVLPAGAGRSLGPLGLSLLVLALILVGLLASAVLSPTRARHRHPFRPFRRQTRSRRRLDLMPELHDVARTSRQHVRAAPSRRPRGTRGLHLTTSQGAPSRSGSL